MVISTATWLGWLAISIISPHTHRTFIAIFHTAMAILTAIMAILMVTVIRMKVTIMHMKVMIIYVRVTIMHMKVMVIIIICMTMRMKIRKAIHHKCIITTKLALLPMSATICAIIYLLQKFINLHHLQL